MKVCDLEGPALEYWFKQATRQWVQGHGALTLEEYIEYGGMPEMFSWDEIGPIIDREIICLNHPEKEWVAWRFVDDPDGSPQFTMNGQTPIIAVMRCVIASKYGENVV